MKYFLHDTNSFQDEKITELFMHFGYEGLGLFYTLLEKLALQEKPVKTDVLKRQLQVGKRLEKCWSFMEEIGIISSSNGETFNERILSYSETYEIKKEKTRKRVSQFRERQANPENVTHYERVSNASKVKESKVNNIDINSRELSGDEIDMVIEYLHVTKQVDLSTNQTLALFAAFKAKNAARASYKDASEIFPHFLETLKFEKFENGTFKQSTRDPPVVKLGTSAARIQKAKEW